MLACDLIPESKKEIFVYSIIWFTLKNIWKIFPYFQLFTTRYTKKINESFGAQSKKKTKLSFLGIEQFAVLIQVNKAL